MICPENTVSRSLAGPNSNLTSDRPSLIDSDLRWLGQTGHHLLTWDDEAYPSLLRKISSPPAALFVAGQPGVLWQPQLAIIGSRNPTAGGRDHAQAFTRELCRNGLTVTSGLASGIDSPDRADSVLLYCVGDLFIVPSTKYQVPGRGAGCRKDVPSLPHVA